MKKNIIIVICAILFTGNVSATLIVNGSLTDFIANSGVPSGWSINSKSPDTNDVNNAANAGNIYDVSASVSPDGGTWVGVGREGTDFQESFGQLVTGFTIGKQYKLSWFDAHFGSAGFTSDNSFEAMIDGATIGEGSLLFL